MKRMDSEQAFPRAGFSGPGGFGQPERGMSLRAYMVAEAMHAYIVAGSRGMPEPAAIADLAVLTADKTLERMESKS